MNGLSLSIHFNTHLFSIAVYIFFYILFHIFLFFEIILFIMITL
jgi:hypothetical protein